MQNTDSARSDSASLFLVIGLVVGLFLGIVVGQVLGLVTVLGAVLVLVPGAVLGSMLVLAPGAVLWLLKLSLRLSDSLIHWFHCQPESIMQDMARNLEKAIQRAKDEKEGLLLIREIFVLCFDISFAILLIKL